jgi:hypothetical protein
MAAAGIPGTGVGGLFYVLAGLLAPFRYVRRRLAGRATTATPGGAVVSALLALGVIAGIWAAGWLLGLVLPGHVLRLGAVTRAGTPAIVKPNAVRAAAIVAAFGTLFVILVVVEVARVLGSRRAARHAERDAL